MKSFKDFINEAKKSFVSDKEFGGAGYKKKGDWFVHPKYNGYEFKSADRGGIMVRTSKGVETTLNNLKSVENYFKNL